MKKIVAVAIVAFSLVTGSALSFAGEGEDCSGNHFCPEQYADCNWYTDIDCGERFTLQTNHCGGNTGTFLHVEHIYQCYSAVGAVCYEVRMGRRFMYCGLP